MTIFDPLDQAIGPHSVEVSPAQRVLERFRRWSSLFLIVHGLVFWASLCGIRIGALPPFDQMDSQTQAATIFFGVTFLVAGVGMWLGAQWGTALWVAAVVLLVFADGGLYHLSTGLALTSLIEIVLVGFYAFLRFVAYREQKQ